MTCTPVYNTSPDLSTKCGQLKTTFIPLIMAVRELLLLAAVVAFCRADVRLRIRRRWDGRFKGRLVLKADQDMTSWNILLTLSGPIDSVDSSRMATAQRVNSTAFRLGSLPDNGALALGEVLAKAIVVRCASECRTGNAYTAAVTLESDGGTDGSGGGTDGSGGGTDGSGGTGGTDGSGGGTDGSGGGTDGSGGGTDGSGGGTNGSGGTGGTDGSGSGTDGAEGGTDGSGGTGGTDGSGSSDGSSCPADVSMSIVERWYGGFKASFTLTARQPLTSWSLLLGLSGDLDAVEGSWVATIQRVDSATFRLTSLASNGNLASGASLSSVFVVRCQTECRDNNPYTATLRVEQCGGGSGSGGGGGGDGDGGGGDGSDGSGDGGTDGGGSGGTSGGSKNYTDALEKSILFYYAQRSGDLTGTFRPFPWVVSAALQDNPVGGWYDAGDYVKFNLPMAWSVVTQLWSLLRFQAGYQAAGQYERAKDSVRWPLDYLLRCWGNGAQELVVQVGDGDADHAVWDRPQNMASYRPTLKVTASKPGSDVAGSTAAALALGYLVFKDSEASFANDMLTASKQIYTFAKTYQGKYTDSVHEAGQFYRSGSYDDDLCVAALWLKAITGDQTYVTEAESAYITNGHAWAYSWDSNHLACHTLLYDETKKEDYKNRVEYFFMDWTGGNNPQHTPCGLAYRDKWGANRYAANAAFMALIASTYGLGSKNGRDVNQFAVEQINYMLGDNAERSGSNCYSFLIGYGDNYPRQPHHRAASCPTDTSQPCVLDEGQPNPNELTGALVGGPDQSDHYTDRRSDYVQNEVAVDYNAGLQGALAGIVQLETEGKMPTTNNRCKCP